MYFNMGSNPNSAEYLAIQMGIIDMDIASKTFQMNTFQCVLVSDGSLSFSIFIYADGGIQWTSGDKSGGKNGLGGTPATVGVNAGDGNQSISVPDSHTAAIINISMTSNIGVPGVWVFQVDGSERNSMPTFTAAATNDTVPSVVIQLEKLNNSFLSVRLQITSFECYMS